MGFLDWLRNLGGEPKTPEASADSLAESNNEADVDPFNPFPEPVAIEIRDFIDLHTIPPRDVKRVVEEYLLEAHRAGFRSVRIIHGKGIGVQREMVRSILARTSFVKAWTDAPPDGGGLGATIVRLSPRH
jgi:dsDNA-specific endonuclease/ATPase MutS2